MATLKRIRRNKALIILLFPIVICLFLAGWLMYIAGETSATRPRKAKQQAKPTKEHVTIGAIPKEETEELVTTH